MRVPVNRDTVAGLGARARPIAVRTTLQILFLLVLVGAALVFLMIDPQLALLASLAVTSITLVVWRAENGIILVILLMPLMDMYVLPVAGVNLKVSDWMALLAISLFFLRLPFDKSLTATPDPLRKQMWLYLLMGLMSTVLTYGNIPQNRFIEGAEGLNAPYMRTWTQTFWGVFSVLLYYVIIRVVRTKRILKWCVSALLLATVAVALYAISGQRYWLGGGYRVLGTFSEPSYYAEWLVLVLPLAIALSLANELKVGRVGQTLLVMLLMVNLILTFSTGGFASAFVALGLVLYLSFKNGFARRTRPGNVALVSAFMLLFGTLLVSVFVPNLPGQIDLVLSKLTNPQESEHSAMVRARARYAAGVMFLDYPLMGVGPGNYPFFRYNYIPEDPKTNEYEIVSRWDANNIYLEVLSERGIVGFGLFGWLWASYFIMLWKGLKQAKDDYSRALLAGFIASAAGLLIGYWAHANFFRIYVWVQMALGIAAARLASEPAPAREMASPGVDEESVRYAWRRRDVWNRQLAPRNRAR